MCSFEDFDQLELTPYHRDLVKRELVAWHKFYTTGKEVQLDLGAGCGETAFFYLSHGTKQVISIEGDPEAFRLLCKNFPGENVIKVHAHVTGGKIDIEGWEEGLEIETHFPARFRRVVGSPTSFWRLERRGPLSTMLFAGGRLHRIRIGTAHLVRLGLDRVLGK